MYTSLCLLLMMIVTNVIGVDKESKNEKAFQHLDLLIVNEECSANGTIISKGHVALCLNYGRLHTLTRGIRITQVAETSRSAQYSHNYEDAIFPTSALRAFSTKGSKKSKNQSSALSVRDRWKIQCICETAMNAPFPDTPLEEAAILCFAMIVYEFQSKGFFYAVNSFFGGASNETIAILNEFHKNYIQCQYSSLAASSRADTVRQGDLVWIKSLNAQKNESLQMRAQHFAGSFGEIIPFNSGHL